MTHATIPRWTIPSFARTSGRYPLGLEAVALGQLDADLASGLPVVARHPRYWSMYAWIIHRFSQSESAKTNRALGAYLKPREAVFACAAFLHHPPPEPELTDVIGRNTFVPRLRDRTGDLFPIPVDYLEQRLGGYGQVYRGAMSDLDIVALDVATPAGTCDLPFGELGVEVAEAFGAAIADTEYARYYADDPYPEAIPIEVLHELGEASCFCRLVAHEPERALLTRVLLGEVQRPNASHANRAATVRMFLDLAAATQGHPLNEDRFRRLLYFGADIPDGGPSWRPRDSVTVIHGRWQLLQARDYLVRALNTLLIDVARWGVGEGGLIHPIPLSDYARRLDDLTLPPDLDMGLTRLSDIRLRQLVHTLDAIVLQHGWPPSPDALSAAMNEAVLAERLNTLSSPETPIHAFLLALMVLRRLEVLDEAGRGDMAIRSMLLDGGQDRVATAILSAWLRRAVERDESASAALLEMTRAFVIRQHLRVAGEKLTSPPYQHTFRFMDQGGSLSFFDHGDLGLTPASIRFDSINAAISGLGLIEGSLTSERHPPAAAGRDVLDG